MHATPAEQAGWTVARTDAAYEWVDNYLRWGVVM